jgi:hypothetical protein
LEQERVFPNVDLKSVGSPSARGLDDVWRSALFGEVGSTSSSQRLASDVFGEVRLQAAQEPGPGRGGAVVTQPELRVIRMECVPRTQIGRQCVVGICVVVAPAYDDLVALEETVCFVSR